MTEAVLRRAVAGDALAIAACAHAAYERYLPRMNRPPAPMLADYGAAISEHEVHVLELAGEIAGVLVLVPLQGTMLLENIAVTPEHQGKGFGRLLLEFTEQRACALGYNNVSLYTNEVMTENQALFKRIGYTETGRTLDMGYHRVNMRKTLEA